jgi:hypothetical protein
MAGVLKTLSEPKANSETQSILRRWFTGTMTIDTTLGDSDILETRMFSAVAIKPPAAVTAVTVYSSETADGTFVLVNDAGTNGVVTVVAAVWTSLPAACLAHGFLKFVPTGGEGTASIVAKA